MSTSFHYVEGNIEPIGNRVLVSDMYFGEQKTSSGIIIMDDDGKSTGIHPRWGKVYKKGPNNKDEFDIGDWVLVEHGRWTRGVKIKNKDQELTLRMIEAESILGYSNDKPEDVILGD